VPYDRDRVGQILDHNLDGCLDQRGFHASGGSRDSWGDMDRFDSVHQSCLDMLPKSPTNSLTGSTPPTQSAPRARAHAT
jgi:hypothetical protein